MIAIKQEHYDGEKGVGSSIDWATTNSAINFSLIVTSLNFVSKVYKSPQRCGMNILPSSKTMEVNRMIANEQE